MVKMTEKTCFFLREKLGDLHRKSPFSRCAPLCRNASPALRDGRETGPGAAVQADCRSPSGFPLCPSSLRRPGTDCGPCRQMTENSGNWGNGTFRRMPGTKLRRPG